MTREYTVVLENYGEREVKRELSSDGREAREEAISIAKRNPKWLGSNWTSRNGDCFRINFDGELVEMTTDDD